MNDTQTGENGELSGSTTDTGVSFRTDAKHGLRIGRMEFVRSVRSVRNNRQQLGGILISATFFVGLTFFALPATYEFGISVRNQSQPELVARVARQTTVVVLGFLVLFGLRTAERIHRIDHESLILTTVTPRATLIGLLIAEIGRLFAFLGAPMVVVYLAFVLGVQSPLTALVIPVVVLPVIGSTAVFGYIIGLGLNYLGRRLPLSSRAKTILWPVLFVVFFVASQTVPQLVLEGVISLPFDTVRELLAASPLTAYGELLFVGTPAQPSIHPVAGLVAIGFIASIPVGFSAAARVACRLWFTDSQGSSNSSTPTTTSGPQGFGRSRTPPPLRWVQSGRMAWQLLVCVSRSPRRLIHLTVPLIIAGSTITPLFQAADLSNAVSQILQYGPFVLPILGALFSGATLCLNPLGDDEEVLPALVLTAVVPRQLVSARLLTALVIGFPFAVFLPAILSASGPISFVEGRFILFFGLVLTLASGGMGLGIGALIPRYEASKTMGIEAVTPSMPAMFAHAFAVGIAGVVGIFVVPDSLSSGLLGFGVYIIVLFVAGIGGFLYACRQFNGYQL
jgi:hypothetical protein